MQPAHVSLWLRAGALVSVPGLRIAFVALVTLLTAAIVVAGLLVDVEENVSVLILMASGRSSARSSSRCGRRTRSAGSSSAIGLWLAGGADGHDGRRPPSTPARC